MAVNPNDEEAFRRVLNYPARGIGDATLNKLSAAANEHQVSLWKVLGEPLTYGVNINKGTHTKLQAFHELIEDFRTEASEKNAYEVGSYIVRRSGIMNEIYQDRTPENMSRQENIEELMNGIHDFCEGRREEGNEHIALTDYLSEVSLLTDQDTDKEGDGEKVTLMTIHSAKGLEFKNVFVVGLEENLFPSAMCGNSMRELEEERRLFYVAITRAEERCFLSFAKSRFKYGKMEFSNPSRFLKDIDVRYLNVPVVSQPASGYTPSPAPRMERPRVVETPTFSSRFTKVSKVVSRPSVVAASSNAVQEGNVIEHERFGVGDVIRVEGSGDNCKATVKFRNAGEKQLLLKFARFKVIG
jgi:DNA helicase-2/ATP-dependent DNA helicase PcrA